MPTKAERMELRSKQAKKEKKEEEEEEDVTNSCLIYQTFMQTVGVSTTQRCLYIYITLPLAVFEMSVFGCTHIVVGIQQIRASCRAESIGCAHNNKCCMHYDDDNITLVRGRGHE